MCSTFIRPTIHRFNLYLRHAQLLFGGDFEERSTIFTNEYTCRRGQKGIYTWRTKTKASVSTRAKSSFLFCYQHQPSHLSHIVFSKCLPSSLTCATMRSPLVSLFCAQMGFSKAFPNTANTGSLEPKREETSNAPTVPSIQNLPSLKDRQDEPAKNKSYRVLVTDTFNDAQINKTREWLDSISDEASRMIEIEVFPWEKPDGVDEDELQKWIQDGEVKPDVLDNMKVDGWFRVLLDEAGFKLVSDKKEWVRSITEVRAPVDLSPVPNPKPRESENLQRRKFEWGEWERQPDADPDLVQDSAFE